MGIKIIKERARDYTFIEDVLDLKGQAETKESGNKKSKPEREFKFTDAKVNKLHHKSRSTGGVSMQGHSPIYE